VQTEEVLKKIDRSLIQAGSEKIKNPLVQCVAHRHPRERADVRSLAVDAENKPARATVESRLATPDTRVEIMMICAK
jgi:enamine deaminase RidA (YjgF/YER057c/UK114 family)